MGGSKWEFGRPVILMMLCLLLWSLGGGVHEYGVGLVVVVEGTSLGVNWGTMAFNPLPNDIVVKMLQDNQITRVKLFDADPTVIKSMAGTNIELMVAASNDELSRLAADPAAAAAWVQENVTQYITSDNNNGVNIKWVAVGNEPFLSSYNGIYENVAFPALQNVQEALVNAGHGNDIKATIPCNADVISTLPPYLPSQATWRADIASLMVQISQFLNNTGAPFLVNFYPFLSLVLTTNFPLPFAFFNSTSNSIVDGTHVYTNVFDASYDGLVTVFTTAGFPTLPIVVGEIGWPTDGYPSTNIQYAQSFMSQLVNHMLSGTGTPLRPGTLQGYLFSLLDEDAKSITPGAFERHWGIFKYDGSIKYPLNLSGGVVNGVSSSLVAAKNVPYLPMQWCVMNPNTDLTQLQANLDYACEHGDCTATYAGGSCSSLSLTGNASYAFNNYYQYNDQDAGTCNFQGLAVVTATNPSMGSCQFFIGLQPTTASSSSSTSLSDVAPFPVASLCTLSLAEVVMLGSWILPLL